MQSGTIAQRVLRWLIWCLVIWILIRGIVSFFPSSQPPQTSPGATTAPQVIEPPGLRSLPAMFAVDYLTWQSNDPDDHVARLRPYLNRSLDPHAGWSARKPGTAQQATGAWVHSLKQISETRWLVTVAVRTAATEGINVLPERTVYLGVPIGKTAGGGLLVYDLPSLMTAPAAGSFTEPLYFGEETSDKDGRVRTLLEGFFRSYFSESGDIGYFLVPGASLAPIRGPWTFDSLANLRLVKNGTETWTLADAVLADPGTGARYTCRYTVELVEREGRWYISQITQRGE